MVAKELLTAIENIIERFETHKSFDSNIMEKIFQKKSLLRIMEKNHSEISKMFVEEVYLQFKNCFDLSGLYCSIMEVNTIMQKNKLIVLWKTIEYIYFCNLSEEDQKLYGEILKIGRIENPFTNTWINIKGPSYKKLVKEKNFLKLSKNLEISLQNASYIPKEIEGGCEEIMKGGLRKGQKCGKKCKRESKFCSTHHWEMPKCIGEMLARRYEKRNHKFIEENIPDILKEIDGKIHLKLVRKKLEEKNSLINFKKYKKKIKSCVLEIEERENDPFSSINPFEYFGKMK